MKRIFKIQQALKVDKSEEPNGKAYKYRTLPQELNALLPLLGADGLVMMLPIDYECNGGQAYVVAHCIIYDMKTGEKVAETTYPTMDMNSMIKGGQGTGAACTYAKKGAIDAMFHLDAGDPNLLDLDDTDLLQKLADKNKKLVGETPTGNQTTGNQPTDNNPSGNGKNVLGEDILDNKAWLDFGAKCIKGGFNLLQEIYKQGFQIAMPIYEEFYAKVKETYNL